MPLNNCRPSILKWFLDQPEEMLPPNGGSPYSVRLSHVTGILNKEVHPHVGTGAALAGGGFLTDHGPEHIETVIQRASSLLAYPDDLFPHFSAYEIYILILAIHFHDVGNILGRAGHENKHAQVMGQLDSVLGKDAVEKRAILQIASAHGGTINGDKDTISLLPTEEFILGYPVRYRALAALLRFADELADDSNRAARYVEDLGGIPKESQVYHAYAKSLHSVVVDLRSHIINLRYTFLKKDAMHKFGKGDDDEVYLLDEIYDRTLKMHFERVYCMRFLKKIIQIDAIEVSIKVYEDDHSPLPCTDEIGYRLQEKGYPDTELVSLNDLCPSINISGASLVNELQKATK